MLLVVGLMATLALPLRGLLRSMPPLRAYAVDIAGSLAGIAGFGILSALGFEPIAWFGWPPSCCRCSRSRRGITVWSAVSAAAMIGVLVLLGRTAARLDIWSPYYRVSTYDRAELKVSARPGSADLPAYVHVNGIGLEALVAADDVAGRSCTDASTSGSRTGRSTACSSLEPAPGTTWVSRSHAAASTSTRSRSIP